MSTETRLTTVDTRSQGREGAARALLVVYLGGDESSTRLVEVPDGAQLTVGRARMATIPVDSERVSRIHARITRRGSEIAVEDVGSRNGTWVNGEAISGVRSLASGDEIVIGPVTIVLGVTSRVVSRPRIESSRRLEEELTAEVDRGKRYRRVFTLLMLRINGEQPEVDAAVDRLSARLRAMDLLTEYAPFELAIVLPELDASTIDETARDLITAARTKEDGTAAPITVAGGAAVFPEHGTTVGKLIGRARAAVTSVRSSPAESIGAPPEDPSPLGNDVIVSDPQMRRVYELIRKVADHQITVLVNGETGVGKEIIAAAIHHAGSRRAGPFVKLNCASVPESLLESSLFGHEKGAFTGADRRTSGYFEAAHGGTLFLDEIGEISIGTQAKLLRVLEERKITRVGGTDEIAVDVRVLCATNRDLEADCRRGTFRSDLFFRISAFTILIPPLRDRPSETMLLAEHFIAQVSRGRSPPRLSEAAADAIRRYTWPGNARELRNAIERAVVVHSGRVIELEDLPDRVRDIPAAVDQVGSPLDGNFGRDQYAELERQAIVDALESSGGSQTIAAKKLGLTRRALIYRMEKHGLKPPPASRG